MTQQQYYQPQYPQQQPPAQQGPPEWAQPQQPWTPPGQPMQQAYPQQYAPPQAPPAPPLANGGIDEFYSQPNTGGGPGVSWKGKPDGYTIQGVVPRDVGDSDVTQEVGAPNTAQAGQPQFYRDGRPKFVMAIPLQLPPSQEYPEGEARLFIRGQLRDELTRAMAEVGASGAPRGGSVLTVTLVQRKQGRGTIPQNVFAVQYTPPGGAAPQIQQPVAQQPQYGQPQPVQQVQYQQQAPAPQQVQPQPVQQWQPQAPQQVEQQQQQFQPAQQPVPQQAPAQYGQPMQQQALPPQLPPGLNPEQQAMLAQLGAQQAG